jgi:hypothetical protein
MADRKPLVRYSAMKARSLAACSAELHHATGRDLSRPLKVVCPGCKIPMEEQADKAPIIQLGTRLKWVVFKCPKCGAETERRVAV